MIISEIFIVNLRSIKGQVCAEMSNKFKNTGVLLYIQNIETLYHYKLHNLFFYNKKSALFIIKIFRYGILL